MAHRPARAGSEDSTRALTGRIWRDYVSSYLGLLTLAVFFMIMVAVATAAQVYLVKPAFDELLDSRDTFWVWVVPIGFVTAGVVTGLSNMAQSMLMQRIGLRVVQAMQQQMFSTILRADLSYLQETGTSRQLSRFTTDMYMLRDVVIKALTGIGRDVLKVVVLSGLMIYQNWQMALAAMIFFPLCVFPIVRIGRLLRKISTKSLGEQGQMTAVVDDALKGARQVKAYNMYDYEEKRAGNAFETVFQLAFKSARTRAFSYPILDTLVGVCMAAVLVWGGYQIKAGETTVGAFMSFFAAVLAAYQPARGLASMNATLQEGLAAARRCFSVIDYRPSIVNRPGAVDLDAVRGEVSFRNVDFSYDGDVPVLMGIDLEAKAGETVALVGRSGGGKSTILNLVPRFYEITEGEILIDGRPARDVTLESLRANIGLVTQETLLFNDTIRANIAYGRLDATPEQIEQAARNAAAHEFIVELPDGYDTMVGEHGLRLSGGQRQRVAIARAMLKNAPILLLDEATSALDTESERIVQEALGRLMQGRTTIVIAHRLSTVMHADRIYVLDKGRIQEVGTHSELVAKGGVYAQLSKVQFDQPDETVEADDGKAVADGTA